MIEGSCHCGAVRLKLAEAPVDLGSCNCSLCRRIGGLWGYYRPDQVVVLDPDGRLAGYAQGDATLTTWHCAQCGCIATAGLDAVSRHRLPGGLRVGTIFEASFGIGRAVARLSGRGEPRHRPGSAGSAAPGGDVNAPSAGS